MRKRVTDIISVSCGYAAAIIGAGFASGQEIVEFFVRYGRRSMIGVIISCVVFSLFSFAVLSVCAKHRTYNYTDFLGLIFKNKRAVEAVKFMTLLFAVASVCVMTACAGEMASVIAGVPKIAGAAAFTAVCAAVFFMRGSRIMKINSALGSVIICGIIFICLYILRFREHQSAAMIVSASAQGAVYAGYNLLTAGAPLAAMSRNISGKGEAALSSAASGFVLFVMITLIWGVLGIYYGKINLGEIPMLTMAMRVGHAAGIFYAVMLFLAVLTTAVSNGFGVIGIAGERTGRYRAAAGLLFVSFCMSGAGFSKLIGTAYRFCGYIGIAVVFLIIALSFTAIKKSKTEKIGDIKSNMEKNT